MNTGSDEATSTIGDLYDPTPPRRVGILSIAGALDGQQPAVESVLASAGHTALRRSANMQTRVGESALRYEDVVTFLDLYGHEYALVALRGWSASQGVETELVTRALTQQCRVLWVVAPSDPIDALRLAGAEVWAG